MTSTSGANTGSRTYGDDNNTTWEISRDGDRDLPEEKIETVSSRTETRDWCRHRDADPREWVLDHRRAGSERKREQRVEPGSE